MDQTKVDKSGQKADLSPHPVPPTVTAVDKLPLDKIKLPSGFKVEVWSSGHPGARTMVMGDKGTMFMGTRTIGRVYAIIDKDGKREVKTLLSGPDPAERARLQRRARSTCSRSTACSATTTSRTISTRRRSRSS